MSASILVVDDEADVAELFRQCFRRETRQGHTRLVHAQVAPQLITVNRNAPALVVRIASGKRSRICPPRRAPH